MACYLILGAAFAFAAAVQPGPLQTWLVSRALAAGWRRTLPAALSPLLSDGPIILVTLLVLARLPAWLQPGLQIAGGVFLLSLAKGAFDTWRRWGSGEAVDAPSAAGSLLKAAAVNLLNPNPWLAWSLVLGPILLKGWRESPARGAAFLAGFYVTMVVCLAGIIGVFARARDLGPRVGRALVGFSALALLGFGAYLLGSAARGLRLF